MKKLIATIPLLLIIFLTGCTFAPPLRTIPVKTTVQFLEVPNASKEDLYRKSREWISETFVSGKTVVDYGDVVSGTIIANAVMQAGQFQEGSFMLDTMFNYTLRIDSKKNKLRFKVSITEYSLMDKNRTWNRKNLRLTLKQEQDADKKVKELFKKFEGYINESFENGNDW